MIVDSSVHATSVGYIPCLFQLMFKKFHLQLLTVTYIILFGMHFHLFLQGTGLNFIHHTLKKTSLKMH